MKLEWNDKKRNNTLNQRGLDFADVALLDWDRSYTLPDIRQNYPETRNITYGLIKGRLCVLAWCYSKTNPTTLRIISLRKANPREVKRYG